jgi:hypothetical protein
MPASVTTTCDAESSQVFASACQSGVYYWQDYDLIGENWEQFAQLWESLA